MQQQTIGVNPQAFNSVPSLDNQIIQKQPSSQMETTDPSKQSTQSPSYVSNLLS